MSTILIVDDHEQNRYLLRAMLVASGDEVMEAANGSEALEIARRTQPDLIISDILMPQMDGFVLCRECKRDERLREIPFVFYTATYTDPRDEALALQLGAERFIIKPVETEAFIASIRDVLQDHTAGELATPQSTLEEETVFYRLYNEALIRKLEDKMLDLEQLNRSLAESEERYRKLLAVAPVGIAVHSDGKFVFANPAGARMFGAESDKQIVGRPIRDIIHSDRLNAAQSHIQDFQDHGLYPVEDTFLGLDGTPIHVEVMMTALQYNGKPAVQLIITDITARKRAEHRLHLQLQRLRALHTIDKAITSSFDLRGALDVLLEQVLSQLSVDAAAIWVYNPHLQTLEFAAGHGFNTRIVQHTQLRLGEGYAGRAALQRCMVHVPNMIATEGDPARALLMESEVFVAYYGVPLIAKGWIKGVLEIFHRAPLEHDSEWIDFLETLAGQAAIAIDDAQLFDGLQLSNTKLVLAYDATIEGWSRAMDLRDDETEGHSQRVAELTVRLVQAAGMSNEQIAHVRRGALLHDMGKLGVPDGILLKPDKLSDNEWGTMRMHPQYAYDMLASIDYLRPALDIPYCHHEKWNGSGYPRGLKGEQIPLAARLFAVVDVWDALRSDRPYRAAWPEDKALEYIRSQAGIHFDPKAVELFLKVLHQDT